MEEILSIAVALAAGTGLLRLTPIRIDPWAWLGKRIGRAINAEVLAKLGQLERRMDRMEEQDEQDKMAAARIRILRFGDECTRGIAHSEEHFNQVLDDINGYECYCNGHPDYKNAKAVLTIARIKEIYTSRMESGDFL